MIRAVYLLAALFAVSLTALPLQTSADDGTPTPAAVVTEPPVALTPTVSVPVPTSTVAPAVQSEGNPVVVSTSVPRIVPSPAVRPPASGQSANPAAAAPTSPVNPAPNSSSAVAPPPESAYLPTAADLQESARLRWGTSIPPQIHQWAYLIVPTARRYHLDPDLVAAVITLESNGDPTALSPAGARGLMQVLGGPWDPAKNVAEGCRMLARFVAEFQSVTLALAAYNAGPAAVVQYGGVPPYRETHDYVIIVRYLYDLYSHHHLGASRTVQYRRTLHDLQHFKDMRKRVSALAAVGHVSLASLIACRRLGCGQPASGSSAGPYPTMDPFWPMPGLPDPLQKVGPLVQQP